MECKAIIQDLVNKYYNQWLLTNDPYTSDVDFKDLLGCDNYFQFTLDINSNTWIIL